MDRLELISGLGDLNAGRQTLGESMPVLVYRLFQYSLKDVLTREYGEQKSCELIRLSGHEAGVRFAREALELSGDFDFFIAQLTQVFADLKIGYLYVERADFEKMRFILTISEDLDCSGLPVTGQMVCDYDEGFIAGILEVYTGSPFHVREIDCWASGGRICRFDARIIS